MATEGGYRKRTVGTLIRVVDGEKRRERVAPDECHDVLASEFGVRYRER